MQPVECRVESVEMIVLIPLDDPLISSYIYSNACKERVLMIRFSHNRPFTVDTSRVTFAGTASCEHQVETHSYIPTVDLNAVITDLRYSAGEVEQRQFTATQLSSLETTSL